MNTNSSTLFTTKKDAGAAKPTNEKEKDILVTKQSTLDPSSVIREFLNMKAQLEELLQLCDPVPVVKKCNSLLASDIHNIPLFTTECREEFQDIKHTHELIQKLNPYITWDNHSILSTITEISNIPEATVLLTQYADGIESSQPLSSFPIPAPSPHMVPYDNSTHTVLVINLDLHLHNCTLQDVIDVRSLIQEQCKLTSHCLHLLAVMQSNFTSIYWMIPKNVTHLIAANAVQFQNYLLQNGIVQIAVYPGTIISIGRSDVNTDPLLFLNQTTVSNTKVWTNCIHRAHTHLMLYTYIDVWTIIFE